MSIWLRLLGQPVRVAGAPTSIGAQLRRNLPLYLIGGVTLAGQQFLMAERDFLVREAVDELGARALSPAAHAAVLILIVSITAAVVRLVSRATVFAAGRNVEYELRGTLLERLHRLGPSFFARMPTGEIMSRATNDLQQVRLLLGFGILNVVGTAFALASALYVMIGISGRLTLAAVSILPLLTWVTRRFATVVFARARENQAALGAMSDRVLASLAGVRVVRSFAMEDAELEAFEQTNRGYLDKSLALAKVRGSMWPMMGAVNSAGVLIVFWYGGVLLTTDPSFTPGAFVAFWLALMRLTWPIMAIGFVAGILQRGRASWQRLEELFEAEPDVRDGPEPPPAKLRGAIRVAGLGYRYRDRVVLDDVSFEVPAGGSLAIVGRTGSGKSTLAALLSRLLPTEPGTVFLDGVDVCALPLETVRGAIGYAQQDAFLFSTTVADNIAFGLDALSIDEGAADALEADDVRERIASAAAEAQVLEDVQALPDGFDTVVGERGVQLSGGQKQRVALARALIREPAVLVLDDPLSAVDARTEAAILEAIERQAARRTVVLVTHRVAAAQRCDRVLVLDRGRVLESGTHDELCEKGGLYALFAEEQRMEEALATLEVAE